MEIDLEQQQPLPVDRDGKPFRGGRDRPDGDRKAGFCEKFQESVSRWMLPEDARSKYLERTNCCPPPIFIIFISIAEVAACSRQKWGYSRHPNSSSFIPFSLTLVSGLRVSSNVSTFVLWNVYLGDLTLRGARA